MDGTELNENNQLNIEKASSPIETLKEKDTTSECVKTEINGSKEAKETSIENSRSDEIVSTGGSQSKDPPPYILPLQISTNSEIAQAPQSIYPAMAQESNNGATPLSPIIENKLGEMAESENNLPAPLPTHSNGDCKDVINNINTLADKLNNLKENKDSLGQNLLLISDEKLKSLSQMQNKTISSKMIPKKIHSSATGKTTVRTSHTYSKVDHGPKTLLPKATKSKISEKRVQQTSLGITEEKDGMTGSTGKDRIQGAPKGAGAKANSTSPKKAVSVKNGIESPSKAANAEAKRLPPIKAPVGLAANPNVKQVRSKIGSMSNIKHKPKGGDKKVGSQRLEWSTSSKIGSLDNAHHKPAGGEKKIVTQKLDFKEKAQSRVGSLDNATHKPGGGNIKLFQIEDQKLKFKAQSKIGSLDNVKHRAGGGEIKIKNEKLHFKDAAHSKIGSLPSSEKGSVHGSETQSPGTTSPTPDMPPLDETAELNL